MLVKIYSLSEEAVEILLKEADASSYEETGSHDDSRCVVFVNGEQRAIRTDVTRWTSVQNSSWSKDENDPGEFPPMETVFTASIIETRYHYGSNSRPRATLRVFTRANAFHGSKWGDTEIKWRHMRTGAPRDFIVFDLGEVGGWMPGSQNPSICGAIFDAKKRIRVEVETSEILGRLFCEGAYAIRRTSKNGPVCLGPENMSEWFEFALGQLGQLQKGLEGLYEILNLDGGYDSPQCYQIFQKLFQHSALGNCLSALGVS